MGSAARRGASASGWVSTALNRPLTALAVVLALGGGVALADVKPGDRERERVPDAQGTGKDMPAPEKQKNPLPGIVDQMKQVERRLAESDTGRWTREEQERIGEALKLEGGVVEALEKLIEEIENRPPCGGGGAAGDQQQQQRQSGKPQQRSQKERQQDGQEKPVDPQQGPKQGGQREQPQQNQAENDQRREADPGKADYKLDRGKAPDPTEGWGHLPPKARREVIDARRQEPPQQWRKQIEDYFRKLAEPKK